MFVRVLCIELGECEQCHPTCKLCWGPRADECNTCSDGEGANCPALPNFFSLKCSHSRYAVTFSEKENICAFVYISIGMFLVASSSLCASSCPVGTFGNKTSGHCEDCLPDCVTCNDAQHCLKCRSHLYLQNGLCVAKCKKCA